METERKLRDSIYKEIFNNKDLFCEFIKHFINIEVFNDLKPEDIEDVNVRFIAENKEDRDCDTIKKIKLDKLEYFIIVLLEQQRNVKYLMAYRMLEYMILIWRDYIKKVDEEYLSNTNKTTKLSDTKNFKLPMILPIVFYDGINKNWTATKNIKDIIDCPEHLKKSFEKYIPSFEYKVVNLNEYDYKTLEETESLISLVLLMDKLKKVEDINKLGNLSPEYKRTISEKLSKNNKIKELILPALKLLLYKLQVPEESIEKIVDNFNESEVKTMFDELAQDIERVKKQAVDDAVKNANKKIEQLNQKNDELNQKNDELLVNSIKGFQLANFSVNKISEILNVPVRVVENIIRTIS